MLVELLLPSTIQWKGSLVNLYIAASAAICAGSGITQLLVFPKVKVSVKYKHFAWIQNIDLATTAQLKTFMKEDFQDCFRKWEEP